MSANAIGATPDSTPLEELTDVDLLDRVRHGDDDAFVVLWRRHLPAAQAVATRFRGRVAPEDLVAEASARMLRLLREGAGPRDNFRAYFTSTVRTVGVDAVRRDMSALPTDAADLDRVAGTDGEDEPDEDLGSGLVRAAFARLPERERQLLWMTMVDGAAPRAVAPRLGVSANLVSVRVMRAKEALRGHYLDVWVQQRSTECASAECRWTLDHLSAHVRGRSTPRRQAKVEAHLASCPRDAAIADNLRRINTGFAGMILPFLVAGASQAFGAGVGQGAGGLLATGAGLGGVSGVGTGAAGGAASAGAAGASGAAGATGAAGAAAGGGAAASTAGGAAAASSAVAATASAAGAVGTTTAGAAAASTAGLAASGAVASGAVASGASVVGAAAVGVTAVGAAALVPVAVAAGGATIGGLTISPPVATAVAGLVLGLGVAAPAVVLTHGTNERTVVQQHQSSSPVHTPPPAGVGPSQLPDLGSAAGGALGGAVVAPVVSATVPVALTASAAAAAAPTPTSTAMPSPSDTATATASPSPDPSAAATDPAPSAPAPDPAPTASPTAPADQQSAPAPAGVAGSGDTTTAPAPSGATPAGAPASDSGSGATAAPASGG